MADIGHNSATSFAKDQLKSIVERIERLEEEKQALADDIKEVYAEAKGNGFDTKVLRTVIRLRKQDSNERAEQEALLDLYLHALGMADAPETEEERVARAASSPGVRRAVKNLGTPAELTKEEKAKGMTAAFVKDGTRMTIGLGGGVSK